jgi:hypothetical protein
MIVVFLVMITIMIVPTIGLPSVDAKERRSDRQAKRTNRTVSKQRLPGLSFAKSWRPTVLEFDVFVTIGFARFKKQQGRLNSVGLPNGLFENPRRRFAPLRLQPKPRHPDPPKAIPAVCAWTAPEALGGWGLVCTSRPRLRIP